MKFDHHSAIILQAVEIGFTEFNVPLIKTHQLPQHLGRLENFEMTFLGRIQFEHEVIQLFYISCSSFIYLILCDQTVTRLRLHSQFVVVNLQ